MTNKLALYIGAAIVLFLLLDWLVLGWNVPLFLARRLAELSAWVAFWR